MQPLRVENAEEGTPGGIRTPDFQIRSLMAAWLQVRRKLLKGKQVVKPGSERSRNVLAFCLASFHSSISRP